MLATRNYKYIILLLSLAINSCSVQKSYVRTEGVYESPNQKSYIYRVATTTAFSGAWSSFDRFLYFSDDPKGDQQFPEPRVEIYIDEQKEIYSGCLQVLWKTDYEATIRYCLNYPGKRPASEQKFKFKGHQIILHFERAPNCNPEQIGDLLYKLKGEKNLCRYYFPDTEKSQRYRSAD